MARKYRASETLESSTRRQNSSSVMFPDCPVAVGLRGVRFGKGRMGGTRAVPHRIHFKSSDRPTQPASASPPPTTHHMRLPAIGQCASGPPGAQVPRPLRRIGGCPESESNVFKDRRTLSSCRSRRSGGCDAKHLSSAGCRSSSVCGPHTSRRPYFKQARLQHLHPNLHQRRHQSPVSRLSNCRLHQKPCKESHRLQALTRTA